MIYKRGNQWHMDVMILGFRYRESLGTTDRREALGIEKKRVAEIQQGKPRRLRIASSLACRSEKRPKHS